MAGTDVGSGGVPTSPARGMEVETDYEEPEGDEEEEDEEEVNDESAAHEVEEEEHLTSQNSEEASHIEVDASRKNAIPERNKEVWKQFGCNTEAGRMLKKLYASGRTSTASTKIAYPTFKTAQRWEPKAAPQKPCPQRAGVQVPRAVRRPRADPDDPGTWQFPTGGKKQAHEIAAEMNAYMPEKPNLEAGRNLAAEKADLQDRFRFCGGKMMPNGAMGHVPAGDLPKVVPRSVEDRPDYVDPETGMTREQREIFEELMNAVRWRQERLAEIDSENAADQKMSKTRTERNKEALKLKNDIEECMRNIDTLMKVTE